MPSNTTAALFAPSSSGGGGSAPARLRYWQPGDVYDTGDQVIYDLRLWSADGSHTAGPTFDQGLWNAVSPGPLLTFILPSQISVASPGNPTIAEVAAWAGPLNVRESFAYYTGTSNQTDPTTHLFYIDRYDTVALVQSATTNTLVSTGNELVSTVNGVAATFGFTSTTINNNRVVGLDANGALTFGQMRTIEMNSGSHTPDPSVTHTLVMFNPAPAVVSLSGNFTGHFTIKRAPGSAPVTVDPGFGAQIETDAGMASSYVMAVQESITLVAPGDNNFYVV